MADSVLKDLNFRSLKIPKLHEGAKSSSQSSSKQRVLKGGGGDDDEYLRQYLLFHYQFEKSEGFTINWEQFDYVFRSSSFDDSYPFSDTKSNAELIREMTLSAIEKHNEAEGTKIVFVEHIMANFQVPSGLLCWLTFWARDMNSSSPESKIYQAKAWRRGKLFKLYIFRLKPTDKEIDSIEVQPPSPMRADFDKPPISFARAGPEDGVPFVFDRTGAGVDPDRFTPGW
ncbi:uncharacterized protein LOC18019209 [Eutrema salsugineum]|uniref:uncharacterized protein LOC18019209 n=1 Tax=Eutrema salsugineum TaxID=72664 RepID=UPI000CED662D|nr:uncharacterized protein LOC18019209 [Eutrema salsugineum]